MLWLINKLDASEEDLDEEFEDEYQGGEEQTNEIGVLQMLRHHRENEEGEEFGYNSFEDDY